MDEFPVFGQEVAVDSFELSGGRELTISSNQCLNVGDVFADSFPGLLFALLDFFL